MEVKQRLVCPKCGKGFIVNPKPPEEWVHFVGEYEPRLIHGTRIPHCASCHQRYLIGFNDETLEIEITDI